MRLIFPFLLLSVTISCAKKDEPKPEPKPEKSRFEMYEMSEMAMVMEQMFAENNRLRQEIIDGKKLGEMPDHFKKIHSAAMTDPEENDDFFKNKAALFLDSQQMIYSDQPNAKKHFNDAVTACIDCHKVKCAGPVARIKKLYIPH